jgi:CDGSH-type Zn-finger protein
MAEPEIAQKSPITVEVEKGNTYFWCTCGKSTAQPFCDGSHKGSEFAPLKYAAEESGQKYFCACKRTGGQPFCDGSHKQL